MRAYILVSSVIDGETWLNDLGGLYVSYLSDIHFGQLYDGCTTECRIGMLFFTWCVIKLNCYVNLCSACSVLIIANYISHTGIKMVS